MSQKTSNPPATSLRAAFESDKDRGIHRRRLSVERLAEIFGITPALLYKRLEEASMPANGLAGWFHATGGTAVIRYLAVQAGGVFVPVPTGRLTAPADIQALQSVLHDSVGVLLDFMIGRADKVEAFSALTASLEAIAAERAQVEKSDQPELDLY
ncbi:MAG: hypothetical protein PHU46_12055 [Rhodocyclaceae bacterium]|nr:hypothetical protein [Rhodocyclaceae bacterium]